jgi:hypothetical protein
MIKSVRLEINQVVGAEDKGFCVAMWEGYLVLQAATILKMHHYFEG